MGTRAQAIASLEQTLLNNALAFLRRGVQGVAGASNTENEHQALSFAAVDVAVAVELMLKARLAREHWTLVLARADGESQHRLISGEAKTVTPDEAIKRLAALVNLDMSSSGPCKSFMAEITHIFKYRNRAAHFSLSQTHSEAVRSQLGNALAFALAFLAEEWDALAGEVTELTPAVDGLQACVTKRMNSLTDVLAQARIVVRCPNCLQPALVVADDDVRCRFCLFVKGADVEELADEYVEECLGLSAYQTVTDGGDWPVGECPDCGGDSLVHGVKALRGPADTAWLCFGCGIFGAEQELELCSDCNRMVWRDDEDGISLCSDCIECRMDRD